MEGLAAPKLLKRAAGKEQMTLFKGRLGGLEYKKNKIKSEIFNDKKVYSKQKYFSLSLLNFKLGNFN